jgi:hypothetical protein
MVVFCAKKRPRRKTRPLSLSKASQSLRPQAQIKYKSAFSGGMYVGKSSYQAASVEIARPKAPT